MKARRSSIENLIEQVFVCRQITRVDKRRLKSALLQDSLSTTEQVLIDRLLYGVRHGLLSTK